MLLQHLKRGLLLGLLFFMSTSANADTIVSRYFSNGIYSQGNAQAQCDSDAAADSTSCARGGNNNYYFYSVCETPDCTSYFNNRYWWDENSCSEGTVSDPNTGECLAPVPDQLCENRPSILSDSGTSNFSNNGCNYKQCGSVVDADNGTYNILFCADEGYCVDSFLGCDADNANPETQDINNGCMSKGGVTVCIDDEDPNSCYMVDGVKQCFKENSICGVKNGTMQCVSQNEDTCSSHNGELVCFKPSGDPELIDPDSADHPDNGGNADGDDTNDIADGRTVAEGGDADNQSTDNKLTSLDKKKSLMDAQYMVNEQLKKGMWVGLPSGTGIQDDVATSSDLVTDFFSQQGQSIVDGVVSGGDGFSQASGVESKGDFVAGTVTIGGSCNTLPITIPTYGVVYVDCFYLDKTREFLSYLFYVLTVITLFYILVTPLESKV